MSEEELEKLGLTKGELSTIIAKGLINTFKDLANAKEGKIINIEEINELLKEKDKEIERLHSIIKEVREKLYDLNYKIKEIHNVPFDISEIFEMIEILDKENNNEDN